MLDNNLLRNNLNIVAEKLLRKNFLLDKKTFIKQEKQRKILQIKTESIQAKINSKSKEIGKAKLLGKDINSLCETTNKLNKYLNNFKIKLNKLKNKIYDYVISIPNIPDDEIPDGLNESKNKEIIRWGKIKKYNFPIKDHIELGKNLNLLDFISAIKLSGSNFVVMKGNMAYLHRALIQFMLDLHTNKHGYLEYYLPYLTNLDSLYSTGQLPKFSEDLFHVKSIDNKKCKKTYTLIPTAEVPLVNLIRNEIISEDLLPLKMTSHTPCFRSEAGSYGKNSKGLIRLHQFDKVEIVQIVKPTNSMNVLEEMTNHAETVLKLLKLPYRKMLLCAGETGFASCKTYDLEVWLTSKNSYCEISSCSNTGDFQARRMQTRYRNNKNNKLNLVHILNGSGLAVGRTLMAIIENYQLSDGRIEVPEVLKKYMNGLTHID